MGGNRYNNMDHNFEFWRRLFTIIIINIFIFIKTMDIFFIPLFRQELFGPGITLCLDCCCRVKNENNGDIKTYGKMPTSHDNNNVN